MGTSPFPARQAKPGVRYNTRDAEGEIDLVADNDGIVQPQTLAEHRAADSFRLPLASGEKPYEGPLFTHPELEEAREEAQAEKVVDLRSRAKDLGLPAGGTKAELVERVAGAEVAQSTGGDA